MLRSIADAEQMHTSILQAAERTVAWLRSVQGEPMEVLQRLRFDLVGHHPLTGVPLNVVEQLNQMFTILVSLRAVEWLIKLHPESDGFQLALGTSAGRDIASVRPGLVAAEAFAATHPHSNRKLQKEMKRLRDDPAEHRYIFFAAPDYETRRYQELEEAGSGIHVYAVQP